MLYELLKSYLYLGKYIEFPIEELKESLDCGTYANFANFRKRVIEPAVNDINTYSELKVDLEYKKDGRSFSSILFHIVDLSKSNDIEALEEATKRFQNVEKEIFTEVAPGGKSNE